MCGSPLPLRYQACRDGSYRLRRRSDLGKRLRVPICWASLGEPIQYAVLTIGAVGTGMNISKDGELSNSALPHCHDDCCRIRSGDSVSEATTPKGCREQPSRAAPIGQGPNSAAPLVSSVSGKMTPQDSSVNPLYKQLIRSSVFGTLTLVLLLLFPQARFTTGKEWRTSLRSLSAPVHIRCI